MELKEGSAVMKTIADLMKRHSGPYQKMLIAAVLVVVVGGILWFAGASAASSATGTIDENSSGIGYGTLVITNTSPLCNGSIGGIYSHKLSATGGTGIYNWSRTDGALPDGLALDSSRGIISGRPTATGTFAFTIQVIDGYGWEAATKPFTITINPAVSVTTSFLDDGAVGAPYSRFVQATDGVGDYHWSIAMGSLPSGLKIDADTGEIFGTPTKAGAFSFYVRVKDDVSSGIKHLSITISPASATPFITTNFLADGEVHVAYSQTLHATGGSGIYHWLVLLGNLTSSGLTLNGTTGEISGTPGTDGTYNFTVQVTGSGSATKDLSIKVNSRLAITTTSLPDGHKDTPGYSALLNATGGTGSYTWSYTGSLPPGLGLTNSTGVIAGTPTVVGLSNFTVQVADGIGTAAQALSITIGGNLTVTTTSLPDGRVGAGYSQTLHAGGGTGGPYTWSLFGGSLLPTGLLLNSTTGEIHSTPTAVGTFNFTVQANDTVSTATKGLSIYIAPGVTITTTSLPGGSPNVTYSQTLHADGGTGGYTWSVLGGNLTSSGLTLNPSTGVISGKPTTGGTFNFTVQVAAGGGGTDTQELSIVIATLQVDTISLPNGQIGVPYTVALLASGGTGGPYDWAVAMGSLPSGLTLSSDGVISGTPTKHGAYAFIVRVKDGSSIAIKHLSITIS
ncbi:MAG: putative Ig domain-containing protein [Chloroflexi bacterium]|nr:putative Ig domain-containing protein [Chloroflexota bacterium]